MFDDLKNFYNAGVFDKEEMKRAVIKGWINKEQFKEITEQDY